jgi:hypothetical protein
MIRKLERVRAARLSNGVSANKMVRNMVLFIVLFEGTPGTPYEANDQIDGYLVASDERSRLTTRTWRLMLGTAMVVRPIS